MAICHHTYDLDTGRTNILAFGEERDLSMKVRGPLAWTWRISAVGTFYWSWPKDHRSLVPLASGKREAGENEPAKRIRASSWWVDSSSPLCIAWSWKISAFGTFYWSWPKDHRSLVPLASGKREAGENEPAKRIRAPSWWVDSSEHFNICLWNWRLL